MIFRRIATGTALAGCAVLTAASPAGAVEPPQPQAAYGGSVVAGPGGVAVKIVYTCSTDASPANHLFVAVKQGPDVNETTHTSSDYAVSFYSTNWKVDSGPNALRCDGTEHTQTVVLKKQPVDYWPPSATQPPLHAGPALVQICVYDNIVGDPENGGSAGFAASYTMEQVVAGSGVG